MTPLFGRAAGFVDFGGPDVVEVRTRAVDPPSDDEVRVAVTAASLNPADVHARAGRFGPSVPQGPFHVLGWEMAGTIESVGSGATDIAVGESVIGVSDWLTSRIGTHADHVVLPAANVVAAPGNVTPEEAATVPVNGLTALQALDLVGLETGQQLLVTGAAGAVGGYVSEIASGRGIEVTGIGRSTDVEFIRSTGARFGSVAALQREFDAVIDTASLGSQLLRVVVDGGSFVALIPPAAPSPERDIRVSVVGVRSNREQLSDLVSMVEKGWLGPRVAETVPLDMAAKAHEIFERGGVRGRIVITP